MSERPEALSYWLPAKLPFGQRIAISSVCLVLLGGLLASFLHLEKHHQNRDERPGLSLDDIRGAYHGLDAEAPLLRALRNGHPAELKGAQALPKKQSELLLGWLRGSRIAEDYDNMDLGDSAPAEILDAHCVQCHGAESKDAKAKALPLEYFDQVKRVAFSRKVQRTDDAILLASTHTHALALGSLLLVVLFLFTRLGYARMLTSLLSAIASLGLLVDLLSWWIARDVGGFVPVLVAGGAAFAIATAMMLCLILLAAWRASAAAPQRGGR